MLSLSVALILFLCELLALAPVCFLLRERLAIKLGYKPAPPEAGEADKPNAWLDTGRAMVSIHARIENLIADMNRQIAQEPKNAHLGAVKKNMIDLGMSLRTAASELALKQQLAPASQRAMIESQDMLVKLAKY